MNNPFEYLLDIDTQNALDRRQKRRQTDQERSLLENEKRRAQYAATKEQAAKRQLQEIQNQFDGIVRKFLEPLAQLQREVYEDKFLEIVVHYSYWMCANVSWAIGREYTNSNDVNSFFWNMKVTLELDEKFHPLRFRCERQSIRHHPFDAVWWLPLWFPSIEWGSIHFKPQMAGLTEDELLAAITQLYPPGSLLNEVR